MQIMRRFLLTFTAAILTAAAFAPGIALATPLSASTGLRLGLEDLNPIQDITFCLYLDGWNGAGIYECGYRRLHGQGWHGTTALAMITETWVAATIATAGATTMVATISANGVIDDQVTGRIEI
jgi:hypothetical protein